MFGLRLWNPNSGIVVDSENPNFQFREGGSFVQAVPQYNVQTPTVYFAQAITSQEPPILGVRWTVNDRIFFVGSAFSGEPGNWTGFALVFGGESGTVNITVEWRVFCTGMAQSSGFALQVRNAAGVPCFNSGYRPLKLDAVANPSGWVYQSTVQLLANTRRVYYTQPNPAPGSFLLVSMLKGTEFAPPGTLNNNTTLYYLSHVWAMGTTNNLRQRTNILNTVLALPPIPDKKVGGHMLLVT